VAGRQLQRPGDLTVSAESTLLRIWYGNSPLVWLLAPLSVLFRIVIATRRMLYRRGWLGVLRAEVPVVVIGNITVGGTGKTPLAAWLARDLAARGMKPGIVLRGYGGIESAGPRRVAAGDDPRDAGDEAVLLAATTSAIVVAGSDRVAAARLARELGATIVLADDGLQHYRLGRDAEVAVLDASRLAGNGCVLPAGPLREPLARLREVDLVVLNGRAGEREARAAALQELLRKTQIAVDRVACFALRPIDAQSLGTGERRPLESFRGQPVHALAGVGHPEGFFTALEARGLDVVRHAPGDHAVLTPGDIDFGDTAPVLMTGKDAVKCRAFAHERCWVVDAEVEFDADGAERVRGIIAAAMRR
jgi:tetraacyldisaccharide 4'-kinase